jgi:tetratricopeptide (TPR) repeat protein
MPRRYFNWKLAIVLVISLVVFGVSAYGLRQWRRSGRAEEGLELGNKAYEEHRWNDAAENLGRYLSVVQDDVDVLMKYADAQLKVRPAKRNNILKAIAAYRTALRIDADNSEAAVQLSEVYLMMGMPGEAELIARRQIKIKQDPELRTLLARALAGQRKYSEAEAELIEICEKYPEQILAYERLGQLSEERPEDFPDPAAHWFDQAVINNPSSALAYIIRAGFNRRNKDFPAALADLEQAEKLDLSDSKVRLRLAVELINANMLDKSQEHLEVLQKTIPTDQGLWQTWAQLALKSRSKEKMLRVAKTGLKELSTQPWDFMLVATELFIRGGEFELASDCIAKLQQQDIAPALVTFLRGLVIAEKGDTSGAVQCWRESIELGNKSADVRLALASALSRLGDTQSALQQLRILVADNPDFFNGQLALARLLSETGNWAEAAEHTAIAMQISPDNPELAILNLQAQVHLLLTRSTHQKQVGTGVWEDIEKQLSALEKSADVSEDVKLLKFQIALQKGNFTDAESLLTDLKEISPAKVAVSMAQVELYVVQDKTDEAISALNETIEKFPQVIEPVTYLAILLAQQGKQKECELVLKDALLRIEGLSAQRQLCFLLADLYNQWDQQDKSYEILTSLAGKLPQDVPVKRRLLRCEQVVRNPELTQKLLDDIKSLRGEDSWQWRYEKAKTMFALDNFKDNYPQIISLLQENLLTNPADQLSRMLLAQSYERAGELQLAISMYREALSRSPNDLRVIIPVVAALYNAREYDEADQILDEASRQNLYHPELSRLQLRSFLRQGQLDSASGVLEGLLDSDPNNQAACLSLALLKMQQDKLDEAEELLLKIKVEDPNSLSVTAAQIQLKIRQGKPEEALKISNETVDEVKNPSAYILRARTYAMLKQPDKAIEDFGHAISIEPNSADAWVARSDFYRSLGESDKASEDIQHALTLDSNNLNIKKRAVSLLLGSKDPNETRLASRIIDEVLGPNPNDVEMRMFKARTFLAEGTVPAIEKAERIFQEITEEQPEISNAWIMLGEIALRQGQPGRAIDAALRGLVHNPNNKSLLLLKARAEAVRSPILAIPTLKLLCEMDPNDVNAAMLLAETYIAVDEPEKAVALLTKRLSTCDASMHRKCSIALAIALYKNGNKEQAQKEFDSLLESDPNDSGPLLAQVRLFKDDKLWNQLEQKVIEWYKRKPEDYKTPVIVARELVRIGDGKAQEVSEDIINLVLEKYPDNAEALGVLAILLEVTDRSVESVKIYKRILELEPDNLIAINNLAWILCEKEGEHQVAFKLAQKGLTIAPDYLDLIDTRGVVYYRLGEFEKSVQDLNKCVELYPLAAPSGVASRFHLARALAKLGQKQKAIDSLNQVLALENRIGGLSAADLAEARKLLKQLSEEGS